MVSGTHPGVAGVEEHGDGRDVEDREHHRGYLHTEQRRGDHQLGSARHEPDWSIVIMKASDWSIASIKVSDWSGLST